MAAKRKCTMMDKAGKRMGRLMAEGLLGTNIDDAIENYIRYEGYHPCRFCIANKNDDCGIEMDGVDSTLCNCITKERFKQIIEAYNESANIESNADEDLMDVF